jgi:uncharacterized protein YbjT (DUF2867 family)
MKVVVIGGTGLIGTKVVSKLRQLGHEVIAASPSTGINTHTGEGLAEALSNTNIVVDLANSPSFDEKTAVEFFQTAGRNLLAAEINAGVGHHVAVSIVGVDRMQDNGYMKAKIVQENLIKASGVPYTIIRSTQFLEFLAGIATAATQGNEVHLSEVKFQPIAAEDVASFVVQAALAAPINGKLEIAGPDRYALNEIVAKYLKKTNDPRKVLNDGKAQYFGTQISDTALVPVGEALLGEISFNKWVSNQGQTA